MREAHARSRTHRADIARLAADDHALVRYGWAGIKILLILKLRGG